MDNVVREHVPPEYPDQRLTDLTLARPRCERPSGTSRQLRSADQPRPSLTRCRATEFTTTESVHRCIQAKGDAVMVLLASGNREAVERGDTFSVTRPDVSSLSYGRGIHHCLGSALANSMLQHFLRELSQRYRSIEVAEPINYKPGMGLRGPETLSVAVSR